MKGQNEKERRGGRTRKGGYKEKMRRRERTLREE